MSGIFGVFHRSLTGDALKPHADGLFWWNQNYGHEGTDTCYGDHWAVGACIEHFSPSFPAGAPILRRDGFLAVIDAVLYNREELLTDGESGQISDEELLLDRYLKLGAEGLKQVNGDFAGAILEERTGKLTLLRDHVGVRPLFYYADAQMFAFSTDIRGLVALPGADLSINEEMFYQRMMGYNHLSLTRTEVHHVLCVQPGATYTMQNTPAGFDGTLETYWKPATKKIRLESDQAYQAELRRLVTDAMQRRMDAVPGPVGGELSGGLDSGVVDILISRLGREGKFFSWSYSPEEYPLQPVDERKIIQDICDQEGFTCTYCRKDENRPLDEVFNLVYPPYVNTTHISSTAIALREQGVRVIFTGHGGDEGVSHRCNLLELWVHKEYGPFFRLIWQSTEGKKWRLLRTLKRTWVQLARENPYFLKPYHNTVRNAAEMLKPAFCERMANTPKPPLYFAFRPDLFVKQGGSRNRLDNLAIQGAQHGVRYMIPFLDYRVLDFALSIPREQYLRRSGNRYIYREAFRDIMPESLYRLNFKDTASQRNYQPEEDIRQKLLDALHDMSAKLDRDFWKDYLDFDQLDRMTLPERITFKDYVRVSLMFGELNQCCVLQNMIKQAGRWCENDERTDAV